MVECINWRENVTKKKDMCHFIWDIKSKTHHLKRECGTEKIVKNETHS